MAASRRRRRVARWLKEAGAWHSNALSYRYYQDRSFTIEMRTPPFPTSMPWRERAEPSTMRTVLAVEMATKRLELDPRRARARSPVAMIVKPDYWGPSSKWRMWKRRDAPSG